MKATSELQSVIRTCQQVNPNSTRDAHFLLSICQVLKYEKILGIKSIKGM